MSADPKKPDGPGEESRRVPNEDGPGGEGVPADYRREIGLVDPGAASRSISDQLMWIEHRNTELLFLKIHRGSREDAQATLELFSDTLSSKAPDSILFLADLTDAVFFAPVALGWQQIQDLLADRCRRIAAVGVGGIILTAANIFLQVASASGNPVPGKVQFFSELQHAKDWLVDGRKPK
jgi:hypothetical protein